MKQYNYVGPKDFIELVFPENAGWKVLSESSVIKWAETTGQDFENEIVATFVITTDEILLISHRRSEHVAGASGKPVLSAGEICFYKDDSGVSVAWVSNQSTGYCPESKSWPAVQIALEKAGFTHTNKFDVEFIFRFCCSCKSINVVKDEWYYCSICEGELDKEYNF